MNNALTTQLRTKDVAKAMFKNKENYRGQRTATVIILFILVATITIVAPRIDTTKELMIEKSPTLYKITKNISDAFMNGGK